MNSRPPCERVFLPTVGHLADANAQLRHPAERAAWIWHPHRPAGATAILRFTLRFHLSEPARPLLHLTGDQRFQIRCDGRDLSFGPDRCDPEHWTVQSFRLDWTAGDHTLEAVVWWLAEPAGVALRADPEAGGSGPVPTPPMAQMTWRGGLLVCAEGLEAGVINTGLAPWEVEDLTDAVQLIAPRIPGYHDVGPSFEFDLAPWNCAERTTPVVVTPPLHPNPHGVRRPGWNLHPANIPEQHREVWTGGKIRAVRAGWSEDPFSKQEPEADISLWQAALGATGVPLTLPPQTKITILWDLETYRCGYPFLEVLGGLGTRIEWEWAEALYEETTVNKIGSHSSKGHRGEIFGKVFLGFGDSWQITAEQTGALPFLWWRSGRYVRLRIATGDTPLTLKTLALLTTGYPLGPAVFWHSSDQAWDRLMPIFENSFRNAAHEIWSDSPYYEQMSYVGDTRLHCLANYALFEDDRLSRRALELFAWSRRPSGLVAERYPSAWRQESVTYAMLWPLMLRDFVEWRNDPAFVRSLLPALRGLLTELEGLERRDGLITEAPGWPFVDWVPGWPEGCGPGLREGDSSILNLHWVLCLQAAATVESAHGDPLLAERCCQQAKTTFAALLARFWNPQRGLLLDSLNAGHGEAASEHAQFFALLTGLFDEEKTTQVLAALRKGNNLAPASIYAAFYLLEALYQQGEDAEFHRRLAFWRRLPDFGFTATPEAPEPSRSDSHAWGAHPAWHTLASIAGVRPASSGFATVRIAPQPGALEFLRCSVVHPRGRINLDLRFNADDVAGKIELPEGISGQFVWRGVPQSLHPGGNEI